MSEDNPRSETDLDSITVGSSSKAQIKIYYNTRLEGWEKNLKDKTEAALLILSEAKNTYDKII